MEKSEVIEVFTFRPPRAPWGPLDSALMMRKNFSTLFIVFSEHRESHCSQDLPVFSGISGPRTLHYFSNDSERSNDGSKDPKYPKKRVKRGYNDFPVCSEMRQ